MCFGGSSPPQGQPQAIPPTPSPNAMTEAQFASYAPAALAAREAGRKAPLLPSWSGKQLVDLGSGARRSFDPVTGNTRTSGGKLPPGGGLIA